jgi:hypothetical protein
MKNILIFAGIAAAIVLYFNRKPRQTQYVDNSGDAGARYVTDAEIEAYDIRENSGEPQPVL